MSAADPVRDLPVSVPHERGDAARNRALLLDAAGVSGFFEQVGKNTQYILHPDEILADNFVQLLDHSTNLVTPRIPQQMDQVFAKARTEISIP